MKARTFSQILIDADNAETPEQLHGYVNELIADESKFSLKELEFAEEHIDKIYNDLLSKRKCHFKQLFGNENTN